MDALKSTFFHVLELTIVILAAWTICQLFQLQNDDIKIIVSLVISGLVKFARANDEIPFTDYVNKK